MQQIIEMKEVSNNDGYVVYKTQVTLAPHGGVQCLGDATVNIINGKTDGTDVNLTMKTRMGDIKTHSFDRFFGVSLTLGPSLGCGCILN